MSIPIGGHMWAMTEEPSENVVWKRDPKDDGRVRCDPPLVVTQHMEQLRKFVLLSAQVSVYLSVL